VRLRIDTCEAKLRALAVPVAHTADVGHNTPNPTVVPAIIGASGRLLDVVCACALNRTWMHCAAGSKKEKKKGKKGQGGAQANPVYAAGFKATSNALKLMTCEALCAAQLCDAGCLVVLLKLLDSPTLLTRRNARAVLGARRPLHGWSVQWHQAGVGCDAVPVAVCMPSASERGCPQPWTEQSGCT
jgi:hypothetical protein